MSEFSILLGGVALFLILSMAGCETIDGHRLEDAIDRCHCDGPDNVNIFILGEPNEQEDTATEEGEGGGTVGRG